jgi:DNA-binding response OmpR family regulator
VSNAIRALMVTSDAYLAASFTQVSREVGIEAQASATTLGVPEELRAAKYEAVLLDFDTVPDSMATLAVLRQSHSNEKAVVFAVATEAGQGKKVLERGANLLLERPLETTQIRRVLNAAYDLMLRERRRYFRCAVELPILLIQAGSGADFKCTSMNISSSGVAVRAAARFSPGEEVQIVIFLRDPESAIRAMGTIVWDDKHGKTGISFKCTSPQHQNDLDAWLDAQLATVLGSRRPNQEMSS